MTNLQQSPLSAPPEPPRLPLLPLAPNPLHPNSLRYLRPDDRIAVYELRGGQLVLLYRAAVIRESNHGIRPTVRLRLEDTSEREEFLSDIGVIPYHGLPDEKEFWREYCVLFASDNPARPQS